MCTHPPFPQTLHEQKRGFLHATQRTHFTIIPFIIGINLLSPPTHGQAHGAKGHKEGTKLGAESKFGSGARRYETFPTQGATQFVPEGVTEGVWLSQTAYSPRCVKCSPHKHILSLANSPAIEIEGHGGT